MADAHKNAAYSLVATAPSPASSGTSLVVTAGEGGRFPAVPFNATIWAAGAQPTFASGGTTGGNFEIVRVTAVSTDTLTITRAQESTTARTVVVGDQIAATITVKTLTDVENVQRSARSSNTILAAADRGQVICATAAYTQTFTAAATLGAGWWCIVKNDTTDGTTVLTLDPNSSETIDSLTTATMYSGETRLIECDGSNFTSQMLKGGYAKFTPTGGNFIVPAGVDELDVVCVGSGGQGGGGFSGGAGSGGGGGGGGAVTRAMLRGSDLTAGATVTVTSAAGGNSAGTAGNPGTDGGTSSFGTWLKAGGGGGGSAGLTAAGTRGGAGGSAINSATTITAGAPSSATAISGQGATANGVSTAGNSSEWGGGSGGGSATATNIGLAGGSAIFGGPGGGGGAGGATTGGASGATQAYTTAGGASGGTGGAASTKGADGTFTGPYCGTGGGGGGGTATAGRTAGVGGAASIGAGGGGGGNGNNATAVGGAGGAGGAGEVRVFYS